MVASTLFEVYYSHFRSGSLPIVNCLLGVPAIS